MFSLASRGDGDGGGARGEDGAVAAVNAVHGRCERTPLADFERYWYMLPLTLTGRDDATPLEFAVAITGQALTITPTNLFDPPALGLCVVDRDSAAAFSVHHDAVTVR